MIQKQRAIPQAKTPFFRKFGRGIKKCLRKTGRAIAGTLLVASLMLPSVKTHASSIELMAGHQSTTFDLKASAPLTEKLGMFIRARPSIDYNGDVSTFALADLTLNLTGSLDVVAEIQLLNGVPIPRAGLQYYFAEKDFSIYTLLTSGLDQAPYFESLVSLKYTPRLTDSLSLLLAVENVTDFTFSAHTFSTQRIRFGLSIDSWSIGPAVDLIEIGNSPNLQNGTFGWNLGGFISREF